MKEILKEFLSEETICRGTLYLPEVKKPPVIVMGHGIGAERRFRLPEYAKKFCEAGFAVFLFDYRNFGESEGLPRNLINPYRHVHDFLEAIRFVKSLQEVNGEKLGIWGTSFGGGHVLVVGAKSPDVKAVVSQVPFVDGISTTNSFPISYQILGLLHGLSDVIKSLLFLSPHKVPIVAHPGTFALMNTEDSYDGYTHLIEKGANWTNEAPARICLLLPTYRPTVYAKKIKAPVLMQIAKKDSLIPYRAAIKTSGKIAQCKMNLLDMGHFEPYFGNLFEQTIREQIEFFKETLK
ncbi:putative lysophospholipase [Leptospira fainei serovar Hurstbridge str. BUT 6]|uniref:Lysophospholipase n=1 Tax=Leptospira fainei serovar Hurstbridge str. BUT 6 TaxID=1193011 RepID=S3VD24_9LEPT|nr:alpha/beta hydrolase [Leptospira fainei]EPG74395.1 putative lysophospholipase [Leptospira fainei serovar Hurstbridge str. BUT 6]